MLNVTQGVTTVMVGLFIVGSQSLDVPVNSVGQATATYDRTPTAPVGSGDRERGDRKLELSMRPKLNQNPSETTSRQKRSESSWQPEDCDGLLSTVRAHCLLYMSLHAR
jgi:hypothetical protein